MTPTLIVLVSLHGCGDRCSKLISIGGLTQLSYMVRGDCRLMQNKTLQGVCVCVGGPDLTAHVVEALKDMVFRNVWVQVDQRFTGRTVLSAHSVEVNDVGQTHQGQLLFGARQHRVHERLYKGGTVQTQTSTKRSKHLNVNTPHI